VSVDKNSPAMAARPFPRFARREASGSSKGLTIELLSYKLVVAAALLPSRRIAEFEISREVRSRLRNEAYRVSRMIVAIIDTRESARGRRSESPRALRSDAPTTIT